MNSKFSKKELNKFKKFVKQSYPNECCGFLIGKIENNFNLIKYIFIPEDQEIQSSPDHIDITVDWIEDAEEFASGKQLSIIGLVHSHPDLKETHLSETDCKLTLFLEEQFITNPIMAIIAVWKTEKQFRTRLSVWPMFDQHTVELI